MEESKVKLFYRFSNNNEKKLLLENIDKYNGVVIGAQFISFYYESTVSFLSKLKKPFIIDPATYIFARDLNNIKKGGELKKSFEKYLEAYANSIKEIVIERELIPVDFLQDNKLIKRLTKDTIEFQKGFFSLSVQQTISTYLEILGKKPKRKLCPLGLLAPYFYFTSTKDPWYEISLLCAKEAKEMKNEYPLFVVICLDKEVLLEESNRKRILQDYQEFDRIILWVSDFDEKKERIDYLNAFAELIRKFAEKEILVYNFYGEYFSLLLTKLGLTGYCRGIAQTERRSVDLCITGGGAPKRYYIPLLHQHFSKPLVEAIVMANPTLLCNCEVCEKIKSKQKSLRIEKRINEFFTNIDYFLEAKNHFIKIHWQEFQEISKAESKETMKILDENLKQLEKCTLRDFGVTINYLKIWKKILEQFSSTNK